MRLLILALAMMFPVGVSAEKLSKAERAAVAAAPQQIANRVEIQNDPLDQVIRVSTRPFYIPKSGILNLTEGDRFMRAYINKKTGETKYQIYLWTNYMGEWKFYDKLNYETPDGPVSAKVHLISRDVLSCVYLGCTHQEHIAADIPEDVLRQVARDAVGGVDSRWKVRVYGRTTEGITLGILKTEIAGILLAVDKIRSGITATQH